MSFFLSSVGIIFASVFQGFGNGNYSMYLAFMRQVILLIPILLIGGFMGNMVVIWSGFAIAELLSIPFGILLYRNIKKNMITPMKDKQVSSEMGYEDFRKKELNTDVV